MTTATDLVRRLQDEGDLCRNEGANDIASLLWEAAAALSAAPQEQAGWRMVPVEPTLQQMAAMGPAIRACYSLDGVAGDVTGVYRAMLSAAPPTPPAPAPAAEPVARDATGRTPTDYALEHAGYLATAAETFIEALNAEDELRLRREESDDVDDDAMHDAGATRVEHLRGLRNSIYEFRRRARRAAHPSAEPGKED